MEVIQIDKATAEAFIVAKHYSHRAPIFWAGFGLVEDGCIVGVAVYGQPSPPIQRHAFKDRDFRLYELARVVIQTPTRNAGSFLIGNSLQLLQPRPCAVISYADMEQNHAGYLYQATNWTYTGATVSHDKAYIVDGKRMHPMSLRERGITDPGRWAKENGIETVAPAPKHRYFQFCGTRSERRRMLAALNYPVVAQYPKAEPQRYDDGPVLHVPVPGALF